MYELVLTICFATDDGIRCSEKPLFDFANGYWGCTDFIKQSFQFKGGDGVSYVFCRPKKQKVEK